MITKTIPGPSFDVLATDGQIAMGDFRSVVAGYTGRDSQAVQHHIDELAAIGIAPPPDVPMFYEVPSRNFDVSAELTGYTSFTSGEIEPVYIRHAGRCYLGIGSDHTDREAETKDIQNSKAICWKPVSRSVVEIDSFDDLDLDGAIARCWVDGKLYQEGKLDGILPPGEVVGLLQQRLALGVEDDFICLGGTLPLLSGTFQSGSAWRLQLVLADGTTLEHTYTLNISQEGER